MIRKLILPAVAIALLGGCVTGYSYRQGSGDYYYGAPAVEYRYYPPYPYGAYGYYGPYRYADPYSYWYRGYPYGYRSGYGYPYGYPYSHYYHRRPVRQTDPTPDDSTSPWRRLDELRRRQQGGGAYVPPPQVDPVDRTSDDDSSARHRVDQTRRRQPEGGIAPPRRVNPGTAGTDGARVGPAPTPRSPSGGDSPRRRQEREPSREDDR